MKEQINASITTMQKDWETNPRWKRIKRDYTAEAVATFGMNTFSIGDIVNTTHQKHPEYTLSAEVALKTFELYKQEWGLRVASANPPTYQKETVVEAPGKKKVTARTSLM